MFEIQGENTKAKVHASLIDDKVIGQIYEVANREYLKGTDIAIMPDTHYGKGVMIGTTIKLNGKVDPELVGSDIGCLDKDTEVLTPNGWIKISKYSGEEILQYNDETDTAEFTTPQAYIEKPCEEFYWFKTKKGLDQMVCEEHRMLVFKGFKSRGYKRMVVRPDELLEMPLDKGYYGFKACFNIENEGVPLTDNEIRLDIMVTADGTIRGTKNGITRYELHFKRDRKIKRAKELLENSGITYRENIGKNSVYIIFYYKDIFKKNLTRYYRASQEQLRIVAEECLLWDGHKGNKSHFSSNDKISADVIQFAFNSIDIRASISVTKYPNNPNWRDTYLVTPTLNKIVGYSPKVEKVKSLDGKKYCFTVPTGFFVARRNGKIFITGNCGVLTVKLKDKITDLEKLDKVVHEKVPAGMSTHDEYKTGRVKKVKFSDFKCNHFMSEEKYNKSFGTLGGGNHYWELSEDSKGNQYITVHTGSRYVGGRVCKYYKDEMKKDANEDKRKQVIKELKEQGRHTEISGQLKKLGKVVRDYIEEDTFKDYIHDMELAQRYAKESRKEIAFTVIEELGLEVDEYFDTIHNYIDTENMILRKGAVSAQKDEKLIIPFNMRDGSIIAKGKGNKDWNYSAPHGAGRMLSRTKAKEQLDFAEYKEQMKDIYSSTVVPSTLDEAPKAYKPMDTECIVSLLWRY